MFNTANVGCESRHCRGCSGKVADQRSFYSRPPAFPKLKANLATKAVVGFRDCPTRTFAQYSAEVQMRFELMPVSTTTPDSRAGNFARKGFPTARMLERELRENQAYEPPSVVTRLS
jgi:hypothetical protein